MAKLLVIDSGQGTQIPFLRGILTRSLLAAGLEFDEAYRMASKIRSATGNRHRVSTRDLRAMVLRDLRRMKRFDIAQRYKALRASAAPVLVQDEQGLTQPFSRVQHQRSLESCGLDPDAAALMTRRIFESLAKRRSPVVSSTRLARITYGLVKRELGKKAARRYLVWIDFERSGRPLILLIGGTSGSGKSTIATALANRLDIVRTQSTDMLREVMRMMVPERLLPVLHRSSFEAWRGLPGASQTASASDRALLDGYRSQAEVLGLACEAVFERALRERVSLVLEGVHIQPGFHRNLAHDSDALVIQVMLAVLKSEDLQRRFRSRRRDAPDRRSERYMSNFDAIWRLQTNLLSEADKLGVPIVQNNAQDAVIQDILDIVVDHLEQDFTRDSADVFRSRKPASAEPAD